MTARERGGGARGTGLQTECSQVSPQAVGKGVGGALELKVSSLFTSIRGKGEGLGISGFVEEAADRTVGDRHGLS